MDIIYSTMFIAFKLMEHSVMEHNKIKMDIIYSTKFIAFKLCNQKQNQILFENILIFWSGLGN